MTSVFWFTIHQCLGYHCISIRHWSCFLERRYYSFCAPPVLCNELPKTFKWVMFPETYRTLNVECSCNFQFGIINCIWHLQRFKTHVPGCNNLNITRGYKRFVQKTSELHAHNKRLRTKNVLYTFCRMLLLNDTFGVYNINETYASILVL